MRDAKEFVRKLNVVSTAGKNEEDDEEKEKEESEKHENNQKFGLLEAFARIGAWNYAVKIICQLPTYFATAQPGVSKQLCRLVKAYQH